MIEATERRRRYPSRAKELFAFVAFASLAPSCGGEASQRASQVGPTRGPEPAAEGAATEPGSLDSPETEPRSITEAQELIERARERLARANVAAPVDEWTDASADVAGSTSTSQAPEKQSRIVRQNEMRGACRDSCRALASMKRAVDALCRMTRDDDERCVDARRTLDENIKRLAVCACDSSP